MQCLFCDEPIGPTDAAQGKTCSKVCRIQMGGVTWVQKEEDIVLKFVPDLFEDDSKLKWICHECVVEQCVFPGSLGLDRCKTCHRDFEPLEAEASDCVLLMEFGLLYPSGKVGSIRTFRPQYGGYIHFDCACTELNLPLWCLDRVA